MTPYFEPAAVQELRQSCSQSESRGQLIPELLQVLYEKKWLKLFLPQAWGGLALGLPEALRLEEALAMVDGSLGWTVTLCGGANFFAGYIEPNLAKPIFTATKVCWGGSGAATGIARRTSGGYRISGHWKYATGAPHLTHFTINCQLEENGNLLLDDRGRPRIRSFYIDQDLVEIHPDWSAMGLVATAGHSFSIRDLELSADHSFQIDPAQARLADPVYHYPFLPLAETTLAVNTLGMTRHFFEQLQDYLTHQPTEATDRRSRRLENRLEQARQKTETHRSQFYEAAEKSWDFVAKGRPIPDSLLRDISLISRNLVRICRRQVTTLYPFVGVAASRTDTLMNRIFRDLFTASQHRLLQEPQRQEP
ncbi:flavin-dependent monooxygenase [Niabella terrae]